eukprot:1594776-Rhodomonas_salina.1
MSHVPLLRHVIQPSSRRENTHSNRCNGSKQTLHTMDISLRTTASCSHAFTSPTAGRSHTSMGISGRAETLSVDDGMMLGGGG